MYPVPLSNLPHCLEQLVTSFHFNLDDEFNTMDPDIHIQI